MIRPTNPEIQVFVVWVYRRGLWKKCCFDHAPSVSYRFMTYNDADGWARRNLIEDFVYHIDQETLVYSKDWGTWI